MVDFQKEILDPILRRNCLACHNATDAESDLVLETPAAILKGGSAGPSVVPGKPEESLLLKVAAHQEEPIMPPDDNSVGAKNLTPQELGLLKLWIQQGAKGEVSSGSDKVVFEKLPAGVNPIYAVAVSPDGQYAAAGRANQIFIYHIPSKKEVARLTDPELLKSGIYSNPGVAHLDLVQALSFSPDNQILASSGYKTVKLWQRPHDVQRAKLPGVETTPTAIAVSADGKWSAVGEENGKIRLYDLATNKLAKTLEGHGAAVTSVQFSADNTKVVSGSKDKSFRVWQLSDGKQISRVDTPHEITALTQYNAGAEVATGGSDNQIRLWKVPAAAPAGLAQLKGPFSALTASNDKKWLALATADGKISIVEAATGKVAKTLNGHAGGTASLAFNPTNNRLASTGADKVVRVWDVAAGNQVAEKSFEGVVPSAAVIHPAGNELIVGAEDGSIRVVKLDAPAEEEPRMLGDHKQKITDLVYTTDGAAVFSSSIDGTVRRFVCASGQQQFAANHGAAVNDLALSTNNQLLASAGANNQVRVWNAANGANAPKPTLAGFAGQVSSVAFSADDKKVIGADSGANQLLVFELTGGTLEQVNAEHTAAPSHVAVVTGADQQPLVVSTGADNAVRGWSFAAIRLVAGHSQPITSLATVNATQILSGSMDGTVRHWNTANGQALRTMNHGGPVLGVAVRPDAQRFASVSNNKIGKLWNGANGQQVAELKGDFRQDINVSDWTRTVALAQRDITNLKADLDAATKRKTAEEDNSKKAAETLKKSEEEHKKKVEAAKKPVADKEAADKEFETAKAEFTKAEEAKKKAEEDQKAKTEALTKAQAAATAATKAATDSAQALQKAQAALKAAQDAAAADADNADKKAAVEAAQKAATEAEANKKKADEAKAAADKAQQDSDAQKKAADEAKKKADQAFTTAQNKQKTTEANVNKLKAPAQKAIDERTAAERALNAAKRSVDRAAEAVKKATDAIPPIEASVKAAEAVHKKKTEQLEGAKKVAAESQKPLMGVAFSADGSIVATTGEDGIVHTWESEAGKAVETYNGHAAPVHVVAFGPSGSLLSAAANKTLIVWDTNPEWTLTRRIGSIDSSDFEDRVTSLAFSPDSTQLATGSGEPSRSGQLKIWKVADGALVREFKEPHSDTIFAMEYSPDGQYLASCAADRFMKVFKVADGSLVKSFEGHTHHVLGVSWRADGRVLASSGADKVIKIWDFQTGDQKRTIQGFKKEMTDIQFMVTANGTNISNIVSSSGDKSVYTRNSDNGGGGPTFGGGTDFMYSVDISADGTKVVAGGQDSVLRVWNDKAQVLATFDPPATEDQTASAEGGK